MLEWRMTWRPRCGWLYTTIPLTKTPTESARAAVILAAPASSAHSVLLRSSWACCFEAFRPRLCLPRVNTNTFECFSPQNYAKSECDPIEN